MLMDVLLEAEVSLVAIPRLEKKIRIQKILILTFAI